MLYQEIRPTCFKDVVGNRSTVKALESLVKRDPKDRPHTILLSGPKGCGKSTLAYILAREFGTREENIQKLNTANDRGIETARDIISQLSFAPRGGGSKTYILDEAHRITKAAQEALLDDTENTREHVYFILCTTEPSRILDTLKNRCAEYKVEPLKSEYILAILKNACNRKELNVDEEILQIIAENCDRTPRTALILLEKVMDLTDPDEIADAIVSTLDAAEGTQFFDFCKLLLMKPEKRKASWKRILNVFENLEEENSEKLRYSILSFLKKQLNFIGGEDIEYVEDVVRTMTILSSTYCYGGKNTLLILIMRIIFGD